MVRIPGLSAGLTAAAATLFACGGGDDLCTGPFCFTPPVEAVPSSIEAGPGNGQTGTPGRELDSAVTVVVKDSDGKPVPGVTVNFSVSSGGGTLDSATAESNVDGFAQVNWTLGTELGTQRLEASATNGDGAPLANSPLQLSAEAVPPEPARLVLRTTLAEAQNGVSLQPPPVIEVYDADDQLLSGVEVVASVSSGGATANGDTTAISDAGGLATFTDLALIGPQGPQVLRFSVATPALEVTSAPIQLLAGHAASMVASGPTSFEGTVNSPVAPRPAVLVQDEAGNPSPGVAVSFTPNRNASVSPETAITNELGVAQVNWTLGSTANISYTLTARIESSTIEPVQFSAIARPGDAGRLRIAVQPSSPTPSGTAFATQPVIQLEDQNGNPTPQAGVTVTAEISSGPSGSLSNATASTDASGRAAFSGLTLTGQVGSYTLSFSAPGGLTGVNSSPFAITVGAPAQLAVTTQPSTLARSRAPLVIQPVVQVQDASGNAIRQAGTVVVASLTAPNTSITGESATTDENGRAVFTALTIIGIPGPKDLNFSAAGLASASARVTLVSVETVSAAPSHPVSATVGTTLAGPVITWTFRDAATRPVPDADFTLQLPSGGTAVAPQFSDPNGVVQVSDWTLATTAGYQYLVLRLPDGREFKDSILATPGAPANVVVASGDGQSAEAGQPLPQPLVARVVDQFNNGVAGIPVQWSTCDGAAGPTVDTDAGGYSSVTQPTTEPTEGGCTRASISPEMFVEFHYTVTGAASQGEPTGVSAAQSRPSGPPPVRLQQSR
jgi:Bacterial Ig-like domain (group 1)